MRLSALATAIVLTAGAATACEETTEPQDLSAVAGAYVATTLVAHSQQGSVNILDQEGSLEIALAADGTTTGTLFVPGGDEDGSDLTMDLAGTWALRDDRVTFDHAADTFIRDQTFVYSNGRLISASSELDVVLTRQ